MPGEDGSGNMPKPIPPWSTLLLTPLEALTPSGITRRTVLPAATENEINGKDARICDHGIQLVNECANMPTTPDGIKVFLDHDLLYGPSKAANAGGFPCRGWNDSEQHAPSTGLGRKWTSVFIPS